ncbi:MAG: protein kinase, partial [Planctomycetota bacterium]
LVRKIDGRPIPKVIDFGIAKAIDKAEHGQTQVGQLVGTPEYMSPEQAELGSVAVDARSDIYSLGILLYELLVGTRPFQSENEDRASFEQLRRRIRQEGPTRPSTRCQSSPDIAARRGLAPDSLVRRLRGDLDWIVLRALEKDPARRYSSASELAADIQRHLRNEPVDAGPPSWSYRARKFVRRHRASVITGTALALGLAIGFAVSTTLYLKTDAAREDLSEKKAAFERTVLDMVREFGDTREAAAEFLQALMKHASDDPELRSDLADAFLELGADPTATDAPTAVLIECLRTSAELRQKELESGSRSFQQKAKLALTHERLGDLLLESGQSDNALQCYELALDIRKQLPEGGEAPGLVDELDTTFVVIPELTSRMIEQAMSDSAEGNAAGAPRDGGPFPEAKRIVFQQESVSEAVARNHFKIGVVQARGPRRGEAVEHLERAERFLERQTRSGFEPFLILQSNRTELAEVQLEIGNDDEAKESLRSVAVWLSEDRLAVSPHRKSFAEVPIVRRWTGTAAKISDSDPITETWGSLISTFEERHRAVPDDSGTTLSLAWLLTRVPDEDLRNPERAIELAQNVIEVARGRGRLEAWAVIAEAKQALGDTEGAEEAQKIVLELSADEGYPARSFQDFLEGSRPRRPAGKSREKR